MHNISSEQECPECGTTRHVTDFIRYNTVFELCNDCFYHPRTMPWYKYIRSKREATIRRKMSHLGIYESEMNYIQKTFNSLGISFDHIIPVNGKNVCGLSVPWNIQALNHNQNYYKNNWFCNKTYQAWKIDKKQPLLRPPKDKT